ncbi:MAG: NUDIX hydrolase N-terminal domain-containing protein [Anaerolineales bacterium]|nr:NUDIX hydrolase N-terminal domain-containing protein [Anaerolineales bacterium]MCS7247550.1 NUDIX hydrolase N-terminal domain-containing protein [Anaerolineales bacterium]MDW8161361.1 NUDIX hydrolase N-terminal domain-containing protein [Anaerolineales bacterium]MDW8447082.1 NUDIX hydrolase N-terminal domain-containing protein [Anaerolineales bacterium]
MPSLLRWLEWARQIQAIAQTGLHYSANEYDRQRYERLLEIAAEIASEAGNLDFALVHRLFREPKGYATPRIDVRAAVFQGDRLLLVRERADGGWTMPGGWADVGDLPSEAVEREVFEEAGLRVKARKVVGIYDANRMGDLELFHAFKLVFLCEIIGGEPTPGYETSAVAFFRAEEIPAVLSGERTLPRHIADAFRAHADPSAPTVFD